MAWIKDEYAEEVAVVTTWLATFLPWSISYVTYEGDAPVESLLFFFRFPSSNSRPAFPVR